MDELSTCSQCSRSFSSTLAQCPFCNPESSSTEPPSAAAEKQASRRCGSCQKAYEATLAQCPFCGAADVADAKEAPVLPDFAALADRAIQTNRPLLDLEFHPAAIVALDCFFDVTWGEEGIGRVNPRWKPNQAQSQFILQFGCFYGEMLRREFGGRWDADPAELLMARVIYGKRFALPIAKVYKRMLLGTEESFEKEYSTERLQMGIRATPQEAEGWLRQARHFDAVNRPDLVAIFSAKGLVLDPVGATQIELSRLGAEAYRKMQSSS